MAMATIIISFARSLRSSSISKHFLQSHIHPPFFHRASFSSIHNPLLNNFEFPPFDAIEASHVRPGMRALLKKLDGDLVKLEKSVEPSWPKLVEPLEKIKDRLSVVWGAVNHLKAVKDSYEFHSAVDEIQVHSDSNCLSYESSGFKHYF
ncbi:putative oligopeptidase A [Helianthus anomalus]